MMRDNGRYEEASVDAWEALLAGKMAELVVARDFTTLREV